MLFFNSIQVDSVIKHTFKYFVANIRYQNYPHLFWSMLSSISLRLSSFFCVLDWQALVVSLLDHHPKISNAHLSYGREYIYYCHLISSC